MRARILAGLALMAAVAPAWAQGAGGAEGASQVLQAVKTGNRQAVAALVASRADVNVADVDGTTPLHYAARANEPELVALLLRGGANPKAANRYGATALYLAALNGNAAMVSRLLDAGAHANTSLPEGETTLMTAARTGDVDTVRVLLEHGAAVNVAERWQGQTALMWAAHENHSDVVQLLIDRGAAIEARSAKLPGAPPRDVKKTGIALQPLHEQFPKGEFTALLFAARQGADDAVRQLVKAGADIDAADPDGFTPLILAIINGHYDTAAWLVEHGADPNRGDDAGRDPLMAAVDMHTLEWSYNRPTAKASGRLEVRDIVTRLLDYGADPNAQLTTAPIMSKYDANPNPNMTAGATPFLRAATTGDVEFMRLLLDYGADPFMTNDLGTTAVMAAAGQKWSENSSHGKDEDAIAAITLCLELGLDINAVNADGENAVHGAAARGSTAIIQFLADRNAVLDLKNMRGATPASVAQAVHDQHRDEAAALLRKLTGAPPVAPPVAAQ